MGKTCYDCQKSYSQNFLTKEYTGTFYHFQTYRFICLDCLLLRRAKRQTKKQPKID